MTWVFNSNWVIRPEARGALLFHPEDAETVYLDREGLSFLRDVLKGTPFKRKFPASFFLYLRKERIIVKSRDFAKRSMEDIDRCIETIFEDIPNSLSAPETLHIALTNACDQVCPGCFYSRGRGGTEQFLSTELFEKILNEAERSKVFQFAFGGGEPLLHPDVLAFVNKTQKRGIVPNITTNGNLLTPGMASELKKGKLGQLQISLDGSGKEINARTRPNYEQAVQAMETCRTAGLRFGINALVTRENFRSIPSLFAFAKRMGAEGVNLLRPKPPVHSPDWLKNASLAPQENQELNALLLQRAKNGRIAVTLDQSLCFLTRHRTPGELYYNGVWGCGAGRRFLTIDPEGTVFPCSHFREPVGFAGDFMEAWKNSLLLTEFRLLEKKINGICRSCRLLSVCRGCRAVVTELGGDFFDEDPQCPWHFLKGTDLTSEHNGDRYDGFRF